MDNEIIFSVAECRNDKKLTEGKTVCVQGYIMQVRQTEDQQGYTFSLCDDLINLSAKIDCVLYTYGEAFLQGISENSLVCVTAKVQIFQGIKELAVTDIVAVPQEYFINTTKVALITTPGSPALVDIHYILDGLVEIKDYLAEPDLSNDRLCANYCAAIEKAKSDPEVGYILFCRGVGYENSWEIYNNSKLIAAIREARKSKVFITGLGYIEEDFHRRVFMADAAADFDTVTPTMAAVEVVSKILFKKTWKEWITFSSVV